MNKVKLFGFMAAVLTIGLTTPKAYAIGGLGGGGGGLGTAGAVVSFGSKPLAWQNVFPVRSHGSGFEVGGGPEIILTGL